MPIIKRIWLYRLTVFLSGFLLFQIELMLAKAMLPGFGGSYLVWASAAIFFQAALLLGYIYAHSMQRLFGVLRYPRLHILVLFLPIIAFPYRFDQLSASLSGLPLALDVYVRLLICAGLPFFTLSTASVLLQSWLYVSDIPENDNPYALYSASNLGSMLGLLTYPVFFEPIFSLTQQGYIWWAGYAVFVMLHIFCLPTGNAREEKKIPVIVWDKNNMRGIFTWFVLSLAGCFALLAFTNVITFDIVSVPFLWAIPLSVYLATFILAFKRRSWCPVWIRTLLNWVIPVGIVLYLASLLRIGFPIWLLLPLQLGILFVLCLNCHGRLAQSKPSGEGITVYYLAIAAGGFAGSILAGMLIPCINTFFIEYPGSLFLVACALAVASQDERRRISSKDVIVAAGCSLVVILALTAVPWSVNHFFRVSEKEMFVILAFLMFIGLRIASKRMQSMAVILFAFILCSQLVEQISSGAEKAVRMRNYYGVYLVYDNNGQRYLKHGTTLHGRQYISGRKINIPLSYYHPTTPIGQLLQDNPLHLRNIGMIGLGTGAISAYMDYDQALTIYELDPDNLPIADKHFSYLRYARERGTRIKFVFGDGRISLRNAAAGSFDMLIVDAFNSGSIPIHLMTVEAIEEYFRALKPDGLLLMHISNRIFDFLPVLSDAAQRMGLNACTKTNGEYVAPDADFTLWMAFCRDKRMYERLLNEYHWTSFKAEGKKRISPWTDQYSNIFDALR